jgi:hypothetical protein
MSPRPRDRILDNLDAVYRDAYGRAKEMGDDGRMVDLDSSYQREQLILEVLLDIRDSLVTIGEESASKSSLEKLAAIRRLARFK